MLSDDEANEKVAMLTYRACEDADEPCPTSILVSLPVLQDSQRSYAPSWVHRRGEAPHLHTELDEVQCSLSSKTSLLPLWRSYLQNRLVTQ